MEILTDTRAGILGKRITGTGISKCNMSQNILISGSSKCYLIAIPNHPVKRSIGFFDGIKYF